MRRISRWWWLMAVGLMVGGGLSLAVGWPLARTAPRLPALVAYLDDPARYPHWEIGAGRRCPGAPFLIPTSGYVGFGYDDSWAVGHRHTGFDIFGGRGLNQTPVLAVYDGWLTREPGWKSTVIIRHPRDPLNPARQIWTYYTHMAGPAGESYITAAFPPGTREVFVPAGTLLGFQGNYSGDPARPVGIHLHFSIVRDDGQGHYLNETRLENTLDPSPYLGISANANQGWDVPPGCGEYSKW